MSIKKKNKTIFDSPEEEQFWFYLQELKLHGLISQVLRCVEPYILLDKVTVTTKNGKDRCLLRSWSYLPDFQFVWNKDHNLWCDLNKFQNTEFNRLFKAQGNFCVVDVKGNFSAGKRSHTRFPIIQKMMWDKHQIYVNKIIPKNIFSETFLPDKLLLTKTGKKRKWNFTIRGIHEFLSTKECENAI